tara:strand:+ start:10831 stop:11151 length:321 start_codon:yes stop_codon:yes gene_type:complete
MVKKDKDLRVLGELDKDQTSGKNGLEKVFFDEFTGFESPPLIYGPEKLISSDEAQIVSIDAENIYISFKSLDYAFKIPKSTFPGREYIFDRDLFDFGKGCIDIFIR